MLGDKRPFPNNFSDLTTYFRKIHDKTPIGTHCVIFNGDRRTELEFLLSEIERVKSFMTYGDFVADILAPRLLGVDETMRFRIQQSARAGKDLSDLYVEMLQPDVFVVSVRVGPQIIWVTSQVENESLKARVRVVHDVMNKSMYPFPLLMYLNADDIPTDDALIEQWLISQDVGNTMIRMLLSDLEMEILLRRYGLFGNNSKWW